jgi:tripartite-type tricarboxylate transporter receptor subunit TctC
MEAMRHFLVAILGLTFGHAAASGHTGGARELVHAYPPTGPVEVAGTAVASKMLRTMQRHSMPAFTDLLALHVAQTLQGASDRPVAVTRRPRRAGNDAADAVSSSTADGRTLLLASGIFASSAESSRPKPSAPAGLRPVALVASMPYVLIATSDARHATLDDLLRRAPGRLLVGSAGEKSAGHFAIERLRARHGLSIEPIAYNGGIAALHAVATKQVNAALVPLPAALPYLGAGRVNVLAIAEPRRHPSIPQVRTTAQAGLPDFQATGWFGVFAPAGTPQSVIRDLDAVLARAAPESTRQLFSEIGLRLEYRAAGAFAELLERERKS